MPALFRTAAGLSNMWIGAQIINMASTWSWADGSPWSWSYFDASYQDPDYYADPGHCPNSAGCAAYDVTISGSAKLGLWEECEVNADCLNYGYVCKISGKFIVE